MTSVKSTLEQDNAQNDLPEWNFWGGPKTTKELNADWPIRKYVERQHDSRGGSAETTSIGLTAKAYYALNSWQQAAEIMKSNNAWKSDRTHKII